MPFGIPKIIVVDADGIFSGMLKKTFQETLLIPLHLVSRGNNKEIINEGFHMCLNKLQKINSTDNVSLHLWLQGVFISLYVWNAVPVYGTDVA